MRKRIYLNIRKKKTALIAALLALGFVLPGGNIPGSVSYAAETETTETSTEKTGEGEGEEDMEYKPQLGRAEFWEWNLVTMKNYSSTILTDGKAHASLLFYYDTWDMDKSYYKNLTPKGFISTYADQKHIWGGIKRDGNFDKITTDYGVFWPWIDQQIGWNYDNGKKKHYVTTSIGEEYTDWIKMDEQGQWLNTSGVDKKTRFFTSKGASMGVPYIKVRQSGNGLFDKAGIKKITGWSAGVTIYLQHPESKRTEENKDDFDPWLNKMGLGEDYYLTANRSSPDDHQPTIFVYGPGLDELDNDNYTFHPVAGDENSEFWVAKNIRGMDGDDIDYGKIHTGDSESTKCPSLGVTKTGWLINYDPKVLRGYGGGAWDCSSFSAPGPHYECWNIYYPECLGIYSAFRWYVGTRHLYSAIGTQTIGEEQYYPVSAKDFVNKDGTPDKVEGVMIPKGSTLTIDGGVVSVDCCLVNNGKIVIKNGGTLIVKKGGMIVPYFSDVENQIECDNGNIIIMEGGTIASVKSNAEMMTTEGRKKSLITLNNGGTIVNYGKLWATNITCAAGCKVDNRKNGFVSLGWFRKDEEQIMDTEDRLKNNIEQFGNDYLKKHLGADTSGSTLFGPIGNFKENKQYDIKISFDGKNIVENYPFVNSDEHVIIYEVLEAALSKFISEYANGSQVYDFWRVGIGPLDTDSGKATVVCEKTATFQHTKGNVDFAPKESVDIVVPEY